MSQPLVEPREVAEALRLLAEDAFARGQLGTSCRLWAACLVLQRELGDDWALAGCLDGFACLAAAEGQARQALRLAAAADAVRETLGCTLAWSDETLREARLAAAWAALGPSESARAWSLGRGVSLAAALDEAIARCA